MTLEQVADKIAMAVYSYAPQAWGTAQQIEQIDSVTALGQALIATGASIVVLTLLGRFWIKRKLKSDHTASWDKSLSDDTMVAFGVLSIFGAVGATVTLCVAVLTTLTNIWIYIGITNPGLAIAHDAMHAVLH